VIQRLFFASSTHVTLGAQRGLSEKFFFCTCTYNFQQLQKWFKDFFLRAYVTFGTQRNFKILLGANITSTAYMRFTFKWFLDIFFNVYAIIYR